MDSCKRKSNTFEVRFWYVEGAQEAKFIHVVDTSIYQAIIMCCTRGKKKFYSSHL